MDRERGGFYYNLILLPALFYLALSSSLPLKDRPNQNENEQNTGILVDQLKPKPYQPSFSLNLLPEVLIERKSSSKRTNTNTDSISSSRIEILKPTLLQVDDDDDEMYEEINQTGPKNFEKKFRGDQGPGGSGGNFRKKRQIQSSGNGTGTGSSAKPKSGLPLKNITKVPLRAKCDDTHICTGEYFECRSGICKCMSGYLPRMDNGDLCGDALSYHIETPRADPTMIAVLVGLTLMSVTLCIVLRLFAKARFAGTERSIFNRPNARLMNVSLMNTKNLKHKLTPRRYSHQEPNSNLSNCRRAAEHPEEHDEDDPEDSDNPPPSVPADGHPQNSTTENNIDNNLVTTTTTTANAPQHNNHHHRQQLRQQFVANSRQQSIETPQGESTPTSITSNSNSKSKKQQAPRQDSGNL